MGCRSSLPIGLLMTGGSSAACLARTFLLGTPSYVAGSPTVDLMTGPSATAGPIADLGLTVIHLSGWL